VSRFDTNVGDTAVLTQCAAGNAEALEALYSRYGSSCLWLARSIVMDFHHAEDVVQEAYLDLWRCADRFDGGRSSVRTWLMMLTHRKAVDRVRSEQRRQTLMLVPEHDCADGRQGPDAQALISVLGQQAREALATLSPVKREVVVLAFWGGYSQSEIAGLTSTPLGTVKSRMRVALKDLDARLLPEDEPAAASLSA